MDIEQKLFDSIMSTRQAIFDSGITDEQWRLVMKIMRVDSAITAYYFMEDEGNDKFDLKYFINEDDIEND